MASSVKTRIFIILAGVSLTFLVHAIKQQSAKNDVPRRVEAIRASLPQKLGDSMVLEDISYANHTVHFDVAAKPTFDKSDFERGPFHDAVLNQYCNGRDKFAQLAVSIEYEINIPPRSLSDRASSAHVEMHPADCGLPSS